MFNVTINVLPPRDVNGRPERPNRGATSCDGQSRVVLDVWVKLGHVEQKTDDALPGLCVVNGVRVAFAATGWKVCGLIGWPRVDVDVWDAGISALRQTFKYRSLTF